MKEPVERRPNVEHMRERVVPSDQDRGGDGHLVDDRVGYPERADDELVEQQMLIKYEGNGEWAVKKADTVSM